MSEPITYMIEYSTFIQDYLETIFPSLFVANIAAITLTITSINHTQERVTKEFGRNNLEFVGKSEKNQPITNDQIPSSIELSVIKLTSTATILFVISEIILLSPYLFEVFWKEFLNDHSIHDFMYYGIIPFIIGIIFVSTIYLNLYYYGMKKPKKTDYKQIHERYNAISRNNDNTGKRDIP